jgi:hypothetical protein
MAAETDRAPRTWTCLLRGFNGGMREDGWTTEMWCRMMNEEELFGGGGQSLTVLLHNHHVKAHDVLTWRSPISHTTQPPWVSPTLSPITCSGAYISIDAHQDVLHQGRLHSGTSNLCKRRTSKHAWCCGPAQCSELPLASRREAGA